MPDGTTRAVQGEPALPSPKEQEENNQGPKLIRPYEVGRRGLPLWIFKFRPLSTASRPSFPYG